MSQYYDFDQEGDVLQQLFDKIAALDNATTEEAGLMSASDKEKLDGIESSAEENVITTIQIGGSALTPDNKVVNIETDSEPTFGSVKLVLSGPLYTKFLSYYTKAEVNQLVAAIHQFVPVVADSLPEASADTMYLLYLIPSTNPKTRNAKDEFITIRTGEEGSYTYTWEQIGTTTIDIDGKEDKSNKVTSFSNPTDTQYPSAKLVSDSLDKVKADVSSLLTKAGIAEGIADTISAGTAQEFLQRQSGGDGVNCIKRIKGKTIAWNQLLPNMSSVYFYFGSATGAFGSPMTFTATSQGGGVYANQNLKLTSGHKVLISVALQTAVASTNVRVWYRYAGGDTTATTAKQNIKFIDEVGSDNFGNFSIKDNNTADWGLITVSSIMVVDLTLMFGAGNEPTSVAEFEALYPALYAYNPGVLKSNDTAALLTDGFNQWDEQWMLGFLNEDGTITQGLRVVSKNFIPVIPGKTYYFNNGNRYNLFYCFYDAEYNVIGSRGAAITAIAPPNAQFMKFMTGSDYQNIYNNDICINLSWSGYRNGEYEPYWSRRTDLALSTLTGIPEGGTEADRVTMFPNGMGGAGSAFDSIFVENGVTKARGTMKRVNLGDLDFSAYSSPDIHVFRVNTNAVSGIKVATNNSSLINAICSKYQQLTYQVITSGDNMCFACSDSVYERLIFINHAYSDAASFKTAMSGVYLEYELATPIVYTDLQYADGTPFTMPATILVDIGGVERVVSPTHADGSPSAPFCCDSNYSISIKRLVDIINSLN